MNRGFGNRTPPERKAYIASDDFDGVGAAPPTRPISGILFGLAIVACIAGGYVAAKKGFGRLELPWRANMPMVEDVYKLSADTDISLDRVHNSCKARSDFTSFDTAKSRGPNDVNAFHAGEAALNTAATYLSCLTAEQPERFCHWRHRTHLVSALKEYYRLMARVREDRIMMTGGPMAAARNSLVGSPGREGSSVQTDPRVVHGLRVLLIDGYMSGSDLSPVLHPLTDLEAALQGAEPRRNGCA